MFLINKELDYTVQIRLSSPIGVTMSIQFEGLKGIAEGVFKLFHPFIEVVIHDLKKDKIAYLMGTQSPRKKGDPSFLSKADRSLSPGVYGPYSKMSAEGKAMKSVSVVFQSDTPERYMLCMNYDISEFQNIQTLLSSVTALTGLKNLEEVFEENWQDRIHKFVSEVLIQKSLTLNQLTRDDKKELVFLLRDKGAFKQKNAATYIAQILKVSRATIYGYLKENS